jgi:hypothetical protein
VFSSIPVPDSRLSVGFGRGFISQLREVSNSLLAGKNAGNFDEIGRFSGNPSLKGVRIQVFAR